MDQKIIGRKEKISLPELGLKLAWAKVDTGAYTSSIHAENLEVIEVNGKRVLKFQPLLPGHKLHTGEVVAFEHFREKKVKNSFGQTEVRYLIETTFELADETYAAEFTLSDRSSMRNAILLGRKILRNRFLVDVSKVNMARKYRPK
ncbi:ATP-dependent zinc protease family protein [Algoriphagus persicinus]|uniref:ATP-dependent zinc protease family protein n=1 Tax=Algoriphagus persicinus TaxID=3108754 RepID=UPI002B3D6432|nr:MULTISPECIES: RimK/LysX family protein [unclassified Algoriphagus]MEB2781647.1 RimK/LysX family protein [Algoriphagus sp. C2-6-M1]MEB2786733.1 RimK/LysX family protein [Algoriphagus sp. E1-3-M2]